MVDEGDSTQLIVELSSPADRDVAVDVTLNSGTAIGEDLNKFYVKSYTLFHFHNLSFNFILSNLLF